MTHLAHQFNAKEVKPGSLHETLLAKLDGDNMPRHIAIIMDGNGRWAKERKMPRLMGHREGVKSVREVIENCARLNLEALTIYAFSVENWKRPESEISALMSMLSEFLQKETPRLIKNGIRFMPIGRWRQLPAKAVEDLENTIEKTSGGTKMLLQVALNYGGRTELVDAARQLASKVASGEMAIDQISEDSVSAHLYTAGVPDPDLLIRTSGEFRISNYLLWQIAYSELLITDIYWPDFRLKHLLESIIDFQQRERRFGGLKG
jgi:undecaprenyl diphosphate synthase